jgi:hypothetical protein
VIEPGGGDAVNKRGNGLATASLVTGITSIVCCGPLMGVPAIVLGLVSRNRIAQSSGTLGGRGLATAGMALGIAGSIVWTILAVFGGMFVYGLAGHSGTTRSAIPCDLLQHTVYHYHIAVQIIDAGTEVPIPTEVGRPGLCFYWIHMHADSPGIIHIESPEQRTFTLGDFFDVWAKSSSQAIRLDSRHVGAITLAADQTLVVFVDGTRYGGDPRGIPLVSRGVIQLEVTPPTLDPPPAYALPPAYQA